LDTAGQYSFLVEKAGSQSSEIQNFQELIRSPDHASSNKEKLKLSLEKIHDPAIG
jgi:hypothetical protein